MRGFRLVEVEVEGVDAAEVVVAVVDVVVAVVDVVVAVVVEVVGDVEVEVEVEVDGVDEVEALLVVFEVVDRVVPTVGVSVGSGTLTQTYRMSGRPMLPTLGTQVRPSAHGFAMQGSDRQMHDEHP